MPGRWFGTGLLIFPLLLTACGHATDGGDGGGGDGGDTDLSPQGDGDTMHGDMAVLPHGACATDGAEVAVTTAGNDVGFDVLWDQDHYLLLYADNTAGNGDVYTVRLDAAGAPLGAAVVIENDTGDANLPTLVRRDSGGYVAAWQEGATAPRPIRARALDTAGSPTAAAVLVATSNADDARPVLAASRGGLQIAWSDKGGASLDRIFVVGLDTNLAVIGTPTQLGAATAVASHPWLAGDTGHLGVAWAETSGTTGTIRFAALDTSLVASGAVALRAVSNSTSLLPRMVRNDTGYLAAWEDTRSGDNEIYASSVSAAGATTAEVRVEQADGDSNWPQLAWAGASAGLTFYQFSGGGSQIYFAALGADGNRLDGSNDLQVSSTPAPGRARFADIVSVGDAAQPTFGVFWIDPRSTSARIYFRRVACD